MTRYYIDTSVWRDYYENRIDRFRPLGEWAFELFKKIRNEKGTILYSDIVIKELLQCYREEELFGKIFSIAESCLLEKVEASESQAKEAARLSRLLRIPAGDALHAILARDNGAILVTRDAHFTLLAKRVCVKKPEELI